MCDQNHMFSLILWLFNVSIASPFLDVLDELIDSGEEEDSDLDSNENEQTVGGNCEVDGAYQDHDHLLRRVLSDTEISESEDEEIKEVQDNHSNDHEMDEESCTFSCNESD